MYVWGDGLVVFVRCGGACGLCLVGRSLSRSRAMEKEKRLSQSSPLRHEQD